MDDNDYKRIFIKRSGCYVSFKVMPTAEDGEAIHVGLPMAVNETEAKKTAKHLSLRLAQELPEVPQTRIGFI